MSKSANSGSLSPLEALWIGYQKLVNVSAKKQKGTAGYEAVYWIGYQRALRDIGNLITMQIFKDIVSRASTTLGVNDESSSICDDPDLQQVQKLSSKAG